VDAKDGQISNTRVLGLQIDALCVSRGNGADIDDIVVVDRMTRGGEEGLRLAPARVISVLIV
jgi:hypothetical protein